ncbi:MAG: hypothetical protein M1819_001247 [Sarea resinae]|nr:MAG: hypothetical protein M1819_001247 [Sarea resinae]
MAPILPAMEHKDLSSNWKKLQASLPKKPVPSTTTTTPASDRKRKSTFAQTHAASPRNRRPTEPTGANSTHVSKKRKRTGGMEDSESKKNNHTAKPFTQSPAGKNPSASLALWAQDNDISATDLAAAYGTDIQSTSLGRSNTKNDASEGINAGLNKSIQPGKYIALDCEMVGVGGNPSAPTLSTSSDRSVLARVSIVDYTGAQLYDSFVLPKERVTDWRTPVSGISPHHMKAARTLETVQAEVAELLQDRILVGHSIRHDLDALMLGHPKRDIRDTSRLPSFRKLAAGRTPSLKRLAGELLGVEIQGGEHSSVEDARASMLLFRRNKEEFEREHAKKWPSVREKGTEDIGEVDGEKAGPAKKKKKKKKSKK